jgi:stage II sporulation protein D
VDATPNQILLNNGQPIGAFFSANCGGSTEKISVVWGTPDRPYLKAKKCRWGTEAPWYYWTRTISDGDILDALKAKNHAQGTYLKAITITKKGTSGRAATLSVRTEMGTYTMLANDFRIDLHPEKIRSTLFTELRRLRGGYRFSGRGWGHGVGLCQWGAKGMAEEGRDYRDILTYFFDGAELAVWGRS